MPNKKNNNYDSDSYDSGDENLELNDYSLKNESTVTFKPVIYLFSFLPLKHIWRLGIDGNKQSHGPFVFEDNTFGFGGEPGYLKAILEAFSDMLIIANSIKIDELKNFNKFMGIIQYFHRKALSNVKKTNYRNIFLAGKHGKILSKVGSKFPLHSRNTTLAGLKEWLVNLENGDYAPWGNLKFCYKGKKYDINSSNISNTRKDLDCTKEKFPQLLYTIIKKNTKKEYVTVYPNHSNSHSSLMALKREYNTFYEKMNKLEKHSAKKEYDVAIEEKILTIIGFIQYTIRFHGFEDGNGRTWVFLGFNFLLMSYGLPPCIIHRATIFDALTKRETLSLVYRGMAAFLDRLDPIYKKDNGLRGLFSTIKLIYYKSKQGVKSKNIPKAFSINTYQIKTYNQYIKPFLVSRYYDKNIAEVSDLRKKLYVSDGAKYKYINPIDDIYSPNCYLRVYFLKAKNSLSNQYRFRFNFNTEFLLGMIRNEEFNFFTQIVIFHVFLNLNKNLVVRMSKELWISEAFFTKFLFNWAYHELLNLKPKIQKRYSNIAKNFQQTIKYMVIDTYADVLFLCAMNLFVSKAKTCFNSKVPNLNNLITEWEKNIFGHNARDNNSNPRKNKSQIFNEIAEKFSTTKPYQNLKQLNICLNTMCLSNLELSKKKKHKLTDIKFNYKKFFSVPSFMW